GGGVLVRDDLRARALLDGARVSEVPRLDLLRRGAPELIGEPRPRLSGRGERRAATAGPPVIRGARLRPSRLGLKTAGGGNEPHCRPPNLGGAQSVRVPLRSQGHPGELTPRRARGAGSGPAASVGPRPGGALLV